MVFACQKAEQLHIGSLVEEGAQQRPVTHDGVMNEGAIIFRLERPRSIDCGQLRIECALTGSIDRAGFGQCRLLGPWHGPDGRSPFKINLLLVEMPVPGPDAEMQKLLAFIFIPRQPGKSADFGILPVAETEAKIIVLNVKYPQGPGQALVVSLVERHDADRARKE